MEPKDCPHALQVTEPNASGRYHVLCALLSGAVGFKRGSHNRFCERCIKGRWHERDPWAVAEMRQQMKGGIEARFHAGDCPRYVECETLDLTDLMALRAECKAQGMVEQKAAALAERFGLTSVLAAIKAE